MSGHTYTNKSNSSLQFGGPHLKGLDESLRAGGDVGIAEDSVSHVGHGAAAVGGG